jgi:hypothetical protein
MVQQIDPGSPSYQQLLPLRQSQGKSNSRKDFYWDLIQGLSEPQRFSLDRLFIDHLGPHDKAEAEAIRDIVFGGGRPVATTVVPVDLWNSEKLITAWPTSTVPLTPPLQPANDTELHLS